MQAIELDSTANPEPCSFHNDSQAMVVVLNNAHSFHSNLVQLVTLYPASTTNATSRSSINFNQNHPNLPLAQTTPPVSQKRQRDHVLPAALS